MKKYPRNSRCPCDSGKKYKSCCIDKGFSWVVDDNGDVHRQMPLTADAVELLKAHKAAWIEKHGREPGPNDLMFPDLPSEEVMNEEMARIGESIGLRPELVYAMRKTGMIVTAQNRHMIPDADLDEWYEAVAEYRAIAQ